jgi:hypothetical protein
MNKKKNEGTSSGGCRVVETELRYDFGGRLVLRISAQYRETVTVIGAALQVFMNPMWHKRSNQSNLSIDTESHICCLLILVVPPHEPKYLLCVNYEATLWLWLYHAQRIESFLFILKPQRAVYWLVSIQVVV